MLKISVKTKSYGIKEILFDYSDFELLKKYSWCVSKIGNNFYAMAYDPDGYRATGKHQKCFMHRVIMGIHQGMHIDHINHNGLDNRRINLRVVTPSLNIHNRGVNRPNSTGFPGIAKVNNRYKAKLFINKKYTHGGYFDTPEDAFQKVQSMKSELYHREFKKLL